jgi:arylsulfatase A-like enzyme
MGRLRGLLLLGLLAAGAGCTIGPDRPHVVIVVLDTTRADVLSSYGNPVATTPHLDRLAAEGARFTRAYATDFWTLPSHASLFTGQYPSRHRATSETNRLPTSADTLSEVLRRAGYHTAAFVSNPWVSHERGFSQGFESFQEVWRELPGVPPADRGGLELARRFIGAAADAERPFFLFVNFNTSHMPYAPDGDALAKLHPGDIEPGRLDRLTKVTGLWRYIAGREQFDARDFEILRQLYEAEVHTTDALVGQLVAVLETAGVLDETLVVVTSDHGENIGEHGLVDHMLSMYETTTRIPLILRYPARIDPGRTDNDLASLVDVAPTVLDACGLPADALASAGTSLLDPTRSPAEFVIAENDRPINGVELLHGAFPDFDTTAIDRPMRMLRTSRYKLVWRGGGETQLFDLESDPGEEHDITSSQPAIAAELLADLEAWMSAHEPDAAQESFEGSDPASLEQLRALGYIE